jgi:ATP-dependent exoDNAse (exonuclease V) beta subunit
LLNAIAQWQHGQIKTLYFEGNINSYTFADEGASLYDVLNLYNGKKDKIKDKLIAEMKTMKELEDYIEKTEDNSLAMIVEVVKEFGNKLPSLINELKTNHTGSKEEADMIFSTVHRCKGMEYDEVTLLNDFINEEKLKKYILQYGGDKMNEADKNRLAEEINILYVAATRAKKKLIIPPEINPLRSIEMAKPQHTVINTGRGYQSSRYKDDWELYSRTAVNNNSSQLKNNVSKKPGNHGKRWTDEEEDSLEELFVKEVPVKEIARKLGRGENSIRQKLINMGLLDEEDVF